MNNIKKFIDRISYLENRGSKDLVIPMSDARLIRDELFKLLLDINNIETKEEIVKIEVNGGKF